MFFFIAAKCYLRLKAYVYMISTFEIPNFLQIYLYLEDDNVADAYLKSANETFFFNLVIWKEQVYCILWERLPVAIVLIRG